MRLIDFVQDLREKCDYAATLGRTETDIIATYVAPNSGFLGRNFRPRYLGDNEAGEGRYGLTFNGARRLLHLLRGEEPPQRIEK